jgi:pimeloyl-ACP methyl ester carboxylesterase
MEEREHKAIARMGWEELERTLQVPDREKREVSPRDKALRAYFGDEEYDYLRRLATHARAVRSQGELRGNVVLVPGIMGSDLATIDEEGDEDLVWINLFRLVFGQMERLKLSPDGSSSADERIRVVPTGPDRRTYTRVILWLRASWNVEPFAFDWRKDMDDSADALAAFIRNKFPGQPVHLVAHSMGGLLCRNFIRRHRDQWDEIGGADKTGGGRLVMLGTPNYGSFAIPMTMTGSENLVKLLAAADLTNDLSQILGIVNTFPGSYEMLPSPGKLSPSLQMLYRRDTWGDFPVSHAHLARAFQFHRDLEQDETIDPDRMTYVAGCNQETPAGLTFVAPGEFDYTVTYDGDGRVSHALGLLPGVPTYYVDESHGGLPRNEKVLSALQELLEKGETRALPQAPIVSRAAPPSGLQRLSRTREQETGRQLREISLRLKDKKEIRDEELRFVEETIRSAAMAQAQRLEKPLRQEERKSLRHEKQVPFLVEVVRGDVTQVKTPLLAIGHYKGVAPVNAEGAIDKTLDHWITKAGEQGMIGAELGQLFFIPVTKGQIGAKTVVLAGMGDAGGFLKHDLRYLMTNVVYAASALKLDTFTTVLIGSGAGNLSKERALRGMLEGVADALRRLPEKDRIKSLSLIEYDEKVCDAIMGSLKQMISRKVLPDLALRTTSRKMALPGRLRRKPVPADMQDKQPPGTRITVERDRDVFRFSALSESAVIPVREVEVQSLLASGAAERLMSSLDEDEQTKYGQLLASYLIPEDFRQLIEDAESLTLIVDRSTASLPWEMGCLKSARGPVFFGPDLKLTRQFRTVLAAPGTAPPLNRSLKVLVIADPAPEPELQLPGARREGRAIVDILNRFKNDGGLDITVYDHIGANACDPVEILALLFNEELDIVHFAGHGTFDEKNPSHSGWVFGKDSILSAREIFQTRRVPRLVFANACFSAVVKEKRTSAPDETNRRLAGLAQAFFERGIQNYIGAGWPVDDVPAAECAAAFYSSAVEGKTLGESLADARNKIMGQGSTWGAYQHYGQVNGVVVVSR